LDGGAAGEVRLVRRIVYAAIENRGGYPGPDPIRGSGPALPEDPGSA
jgi:hypothetical protein